MPLLHKKPFRLEPLPGDLKPDEEVFVCHATKEVFRDYEKYFNRHFLCNSLVWTCELTGQTNLTYSQAMQSEKEARRVMDSLPECFQKAALSLVHHVRRTNVKTLADEVCAFYRLRFVEGEELGLRKKTASGAEVIIPVRVVKVIPPSETSPRSRSRSPTKLASPTSPPKLQSPHALNSKPKHSSPPGLYPVQSNGSRSPTNPSKFPSPGSPPSTPVKINSNSHTVTGTASPHHPIKSPVRVSVISKVLKSPPPLLPINNIKDSALSSSTLNCSEDPLAIMSKNSPSKSLTAQHQQNGLPESSHKASNSSSTGSGKESSDVKFRTPKPPSAPLTPEIELDPNDYRYMVEEVNNPDSKVLVKPSQITREKGVLVPKKVKIFLRNALHRVSEKHPFTVKEEYVKKFGLGPSSVDLMSLASPTPTKSSRKRSYSQTSLETFVTPSGSNASLPSAALSGGTSPKKRGRPTSLGSMSKRRSSSAKKPRKSPKAPSGRGSKGVKKSTAKSPKRRKSTSKTPKSASKGAIVFPKVGASPGSPKKVLPTAPVKVPKSPRTPKSPQTPRSKLEALKALNKAKKFKQMDLKKNLVKQEKRTLTEEELAIIRKLAEEERLLKIALREAEKQKRKEERQRKLHEQQEQRRLEKMRQKELMKPREDLLCVNSKPLPDPTPVKSLIPHEEFGSAVMVLEFLNTFGPLFNIREAIRGGITIDKVEYALAYEETDSLLFDIIKFLLQAIFATMEEEHESIVHIKKSSTKLLKQSPTTLSIDSEPMETSKEATTTTGSAAEDQSKDKVVDSEKSSPDADESKTLGKEEGEKMEVMDNAEGALSGDEEDKEQSQPLSVQVESIMSSASSYSKWSRQTQSVDLDKLVLDPYTCTEVLRLHLLSSGGYDDSVDRNSFRHSRRGGYSDADDPAVALRLNHPDVIRSLANTSVYSLPVGDKLAVLSTLCSQLLSYAVSREFIDEACARAKKARRQIREIQANEEKRKKEQKAAIMKEKKEEKERLKKKQENGKKETKPGEPGAGESGVGGVENTKTEPPKSGDAAEVSTSEENKTDPAGSVPAAADKKEGESDEKEVSPKEPPNVDKEGESDGTKQEGVEDEEERKARIEEDIFELNEQLAEAASAVNLRPLGSDRYHRKYWVFPNLPGLFVEESGEHPQDSDVSQKVPSVGACPLPGERAEQPGEVNPSHQVAVVDLTKSIPGEQELPKPPPLIPISEVLSVVQQEEKCLSINNSSMISAASSVSTPGDGSTAEVSLTEETPVLPPRSSTGTKWSCYRSQEEVSDLLNSLNPRGVREVELKRIISEQRKHFEQNISKCPFQSIEEHPSSQLPLPKYTSADEYLELYLRELILDIEEKIHLGNLGYLRGVDERAKWRDLIENSGAAAALNPSADDNALSDKDTTTAAQHGDAGQSRSRSTTPYFNDDGSKRKASSPVSPSVHELAKALLQVQAGIEKKYLMPPLGMAVDNKRRRRQNDKKVVKDSDVCVDEWRASLAKATSFSQIFVHLATLERCVMWSKSLMNVRCRICRRKCGDQFMLLCDGCDHGYHTYCLKPPLKDIPQGDWFCYDCCPVTPVKPRRRAQRVVIVEESSESEQEDEVQKSDDEEEASDQEEEEEEEKDGEEEEESEEEEEEPVTTRRSLRSVQAKGTEVAVSSRRGSRGKASSQTNVKKQAKAGKAKGKLSKSEPAKAKKAEVGVKRPRGRPPGRPRRHSDSSQSASTTSSTPDVATGRGRGPSARKKLKLDHVPSPVQLQSKAENVIASIIDLRCSKEGRRSQSSREQKALEAQLCEAIWEEISEQENSVHFDLPVKKREYPDYHDIIDHPMDLRTIKAKIKSLTYDKLDEFLEDMELIFDNCLKYHKRHSRIGKAGASLKKFFEKRCADLGLKDLSLCSPVVDIGSDGDAKGARRSSARSRR